MFGLLVVAAFVIYFAPSVIAMSREHLDTPSIVLLNVFFGWTVLGWVVALCWSAANKPLKGLTS